MRAIRTLTACPAVCPEASHWVKRLLPLFIIAVHNSWKLLRVPFGLLDVVLLIRNSTPTADEALEFDVVDSP